jgi:hypothetical protein
MIDLEDFMRYVYNEKEKDKKQYENAVSAIINQSSIT